MRAERALTACIGISAYPAAVLAPGERPLRYLANGARHLSHLFSRVWPDEESKHLLAVDVGATLAHVRELVVAQSGRFDIFVLYLAGHGRAGRGPFEFLFFGERPDEAKALAGDIDALLSAASATNTLLLLDACHAGQYAAEAAFFRRTASGSARLGIASSMADQKSWEDPYFEQSLFADALAKALTDDAKVAGRAKVVSGDFFREVAGDVARHAFALKSSAAQEPMIFGAASDILEITTIASEVAPAKSLTTYQTLLRRTRQIGVAAGCVATLAIAVTSLATWRPAINPFGFVELRAGPKWLSPLNIGPWARRVEADVARSDLRDEDLQAALLDEQGVHAWPGLGVANTRRWADVFVDDYLNADAAARWRVHLGFADAVDRLTTISHVILPAPAAALPSATELAAEARLLQPERPLSDVWKFQWRNNVAPGSCGSAEPAGTASELFDTYLHLSEPAEYRDWLRGVAAAARADDGIGFAQVADLVRMFTTANAVWNERYRQTVATPGEPITAERIAARFTERPTVSEVTALAGIASAIVARRKALSVPAVKPDERSEISGLMNGCSNVAVSVLAALGNEGDLPRVLAWAHARAKSDQGRVALAELAKSGALPDAEIEWVLDSLGFSGDAASRRRAFVNAREWLSAIAAHRSLPRPVLRKLIDYAEARRAANDTAGEQQALRLVLGDPAVGQSPIDAAIASMVPTNEQSGPLPPNEWEVEEIGLLARSGAVLSAEQRKILESLFERERSGGIEQISYRDEDKGEPKNATQLVAGLTLTHLVAVSRAVIGGKVLQDASTRRTVGEFLETALADGIRYGVRAAKLEEPTIAAAIVWEKGASDGPNASALHRQLECCAADLAARRAHADIAVAALLRMPLQKRNEVVDELRGYWRSEQEPEVKLAIADVIIRGLIPPDR